MKSYKRLVEMVNGLAGDATKVVAGNKSAATRLRKGMMEVKEQTGVVRTEALSLTAGKGE